MSGTYVFKSIHSHVFNLKQIAKIKSQTTRTIKENLNNVYVYTCINDNKVTELLQETKMSYLSCYLTMNIHKRSRRLT